MQPEMYVCCGEQPTYLFVYENNQVYGICENHFDSLAHRCFVKWIINIKTRKKFQANEIFGEEIKIESMH